MSITIPVRIAGQLLEAEIPAESLAILRGALVVDEPAPPSPFMTAEEAAVFLCCRKRRVYELVGDGRLTRHGEGRRLLLSRDEVRRLAA